MGPSLLFLPQLESIQYQPIYSLQVIVRMVLVDLSYTFSETDRSIWPGNQPFRKTVVADHSDNCIMANFNISMNEHVGTHMDAPYHFYSKGWTTDQIPLENLVNVPGVVVDISHKASTD